MISHELGDGGLWFGALRRASLTSLLGLVVLLFAQRALCAEPLPAATAPLPTSTEPTAIKVQAVSANAAAPPPAVSPAPAPLPALSPRYALILPLDNAPFRAAAAALRAGFVAAAGVGGEAALVAVLAHGEAEAPVAFERAVKTGAMVLVGPLTRGDVGAVLSQRQSFPPTLLLNAPEQSTVLPGQVVVLALSVEADARQLARLAWKEGRERIAVLAGPAPFNQRFQAAFRHEAEQLGMSVVQAAAFNGDTVTLPALREKIEAANADALLLALDAAEARVARGYLSSLPAYASGQIFDDHAATERTELANVRFVEMPWLVQADHAAVMAYPRADLVDATAQRLYALGIDAYRVASQIAQGKALDKLELDGVTGHISGRQGPVLVREPNTLVVRQGEAVLIDQAR
ncbi:MAG: penicillin-binding protein activator [Betaproteobacteria bacterium]|nr:penicillin-binding protein activator [Betaproteobacteria bacterium]